MARKLTKNNAQFQRAVKRLPLGVASNFRYWGEERTIYVKQRQGRAHHRSRRQRLRRLPHGLWPGDPGLRAIQRVDAAAREGMEVGGVFALVDRARAQRRRAHLQDGAGGGAGALLQFRNRGGHGGAAAGARLHRQGRLRDSRGQLSRAVRCGDVVHADGQVVAGGRSGGQALQRGRAGEHAELRALRAGERRQPAGRRVQAPRAPDRLHADRAHHGQLPRHRRRAGISARRARAVRQARRGDAHRRGQDRLSRRARRRAGAVRRQGGSVHLRQGASATAIRSRCSPGREEIMRKIGRGVAHGGTYTAHSVSLAAAEKTLEILDETDALERIADYGTKLRTGMRAVLCRRAASRTASSAIRP